MGESVTHEEMAKVERLAHECGAIFDREKLPPELATAVLLDLWARVAAISAAGSEEVRKLLVRAGAEHLENMSAYYMRGGQ